MEHGRSSIYLQAKRMDGLCLLQTIQFIAGGDVADARPWMVSVTIRLMILCAWSSGSLLDSLAIRFRVGHVG